MADARLQNALAEAGGVDAPDRLAAQLRALLADELAHGAAELGLARSGYGRPVLVAVGAGNGQLVGVAPLDPALRADPGAAGERAWLVAAALTGALVEAAGTSWQTRETQLLSGQFLGWLALALPVPSAAGEHAELAALAYDELTEPIDRLRTRALAVPGTVLDTVADLREPVGAGHQLRVAELVARLGGNPVDEESIVGFEPQVLAELGAAAPPARPHEDPDPALRVARRILQRLDGMGKWGGYHTDFAHLSRGFAGNERALAEAERRAATRLPEPAPRR